MSFPKLSCCRPSTLPLPCMTDSADCNHIEASFYHTSVFVSWHILPVLNVDPRYRYLRLIDPQSVDLKRLTAACQAQRCWMVLKCRARATNIIIRFVELCLIVFAGAECGTINFTPVTNWCYKMLQTEHKCCKWRPSLWPPKPFNYCSCCNPSALLQHDWQ